VTTTTAPTTVPVDRPAVRLEAHGAGFFTTTGQVARRSALQFLRSPQLLVLPTVMAVLFLFVFRYIFGGAIHPGGSVDYVDFLIPGFLVNTVLWVGMNAPAGVAEDSASGVHDRLRSLPIPRYAAVAGRSLADTGLVVWTLVATGLLGVAVGFRAHASVGSVALACALLLAEAYAFSWVFITLGLWAGNAQAAQGMSMLLAIPLAFVSSAYVPVRSMPGWMRPVAANQPFTAMINAVRSLMLGGVRAAGIGHSSTYWVGVSLAWSGAILLVFGTLAVVRFGRAR
jgi:ABC-2 type transport system permease protein